jgi:hypothetical protein
MVYFFEQPLNVLSGDLQARPYAGGRKKFQYAAFRSKKNSAICKPLTLLSTVNPSRFWRLRAKIFLTQPLLVGSLHQEQLSLALSLLHS